MSLPTDSAARKRIPMFTGLLKYFPDALAAVAELSYEANEKHNPGEPVHWSREKSDDHPDCTIRHLTDYAKGNRAALREAAWRILAILQLDIEANGRIESGEYAKQSPHPEQCVVCRKPFMRFEPVFPFAGAFRCSNCFDIATHKGVDRFDVRKEYDRKNAEYSRQVADEFAASIVRLADEPQSDGPQVGVTDFYGAAETTIDRPYQAPPSPVDECTCADCRAARAWVR